MQTPTEQPAIEQTQTTPAMQAEPEPSAIDETDTDVPTVGKLPALPVVGLGGSAGAIEALAEFFQAMPNDSGMAFVIVIHLAPDQDSALPKLLQNVTSMRVVEVTQTIKIESNCVYVIPPNAHLSMTSEQICLLPLKQPYGKRIAVDLLFRALADTHATHAIGIVLSGADGDGSIGVKRIKERGGLTIAQEPTQALLDSMPRSAIATGMVDWILPVNQMPSKLLSHRENEKRLRLPSNSPMSSTKAKDKEKNSAASSDEAALREVFLLLRARTGHDFTHYKRATILRRIGRRLQVNGLPDIPTYLEYLRASPGEAGALLHDLLISVTNFFRDPKAFAALQQAVPRLFKDKKSSDQVRVWVAGCATGEEAYSVAIILAEYAAKLDSPPSILIFATDLNGEAIQTAREGCYPETITADVSAERLERFFTQEPGCYRIRKEIREIVLFAVHNIIKDSPFSHLDLITCRNLLIYLNRQAQQRTFEVFHYALQPKGLLFLGVSESAEGFANLFTSQNKKHRLYTRRATVGRTLPQLPVSRQASIKGSSRSVDSSGFLDLANTDDSTSLLPGTASASQRNSGSFSDLHLKLLERFAPPSILVNEEYDILHFSENAGRFLLHTGGYVSSNLLKAVHPSLRLELSAALFSATQKKEDVQVMAVPLENPDDNTVKYVNLRVRPVLDNGRATHVLFLVLFEEVSATPDAPTSIARIEPISHRLHEEIQHLKTSLHATVEQYEATVEELKASNEELQAMNEEARSTAEELETGKEELQSVNEEIIAINSELKSNVEDLAQANSDMQNLMVSSEIATIFLDRDFLIKRYTPRAAQIFNLIPTDTDRPISHITHCLDYPALTSDVKQVLAELKTIEREVQTVEGDWFLARLLPYRTENKYVNGVILTLIDTTQRKRIEADLISRGEELQRANESLSVSEEKYRSLFSMMDEAFCVIEVIFNNANKPIDYRFLECNPAFERQTGLKDVINKTVREIIPSIESKWIEEYGNIALTGQGHRFNTCIGGLDNRWYDGYAFRLGDDSSRRVAVIFNEITHRKRAEHNTTFLTGVTDKLALATTIDEMMQEIGAGIDSHLNITACAFFEISQTNDEAVATYDWHRSNTPHIRGSYRISDFFTREFRQRFCSGESLIVNNIFTDSRVIAENYEALNAASFISVPVAFDGEWHFSFAVFDAAPRNWRSDEIELMREVTTRVWAGIERRRGEEALRESEERLRLSIEASNAFTWEINVQTNQSKFSANVRDVLGFMLPADTREIFALIHPRDNQNVLREATLAIQGKKQLEVEHRIINPQNNEIIWVRVQGVFIKEEQSSSSRLLGITQNITTRKKMEEELSKSEERYRVFIEGIEDYAIFLTDLEANITFWNSGVERLLGYSEEEFIGQPASIIFTPADRAAGILEREQKLALQTGRAPDERWFIRKDGSLFYASSVMITLRDEGGNIRGYAKILRDMTDRKKMEEELEARVQERTQELVDLNNELSIESAQRLELERTRQQLLERVVSTQEEERLRISRELHDQMGQQLTALLLGLKSLPSALDTTGATDISPRLESLQTLTSDLMDQVHNLAWELRPAALDNLGLEAAVRQYAKQWSKENNVSIDFISRGITHDKRLSSLIETTLYRVIQESLTNVQRHAQARHVSILLERIHNFVIAIIEDDGRGFDPEETQAKASNGTFERLGLIGMKERMELVGGTLTIESTINAGTSIYARVPIGFEANE